MSVAELRSASETDLHKKLQDLYAEELKLRMQLASGNLTKNHLVRAKRKEIARTKTVLAEKMNEGAGV